MPGYGRLITIEGVDGTGKTTLAAALRDALADRGIDVRLLREPGSTAASERIRTLVKDPGLRIGERAEALLYAAARAQLCEEVIAPALASGTWILLDRFVDSSLVYQGIARGLGVSRIAELNAFATGPIAPDRTILLVLDPAVALARARGRGETPDRLEQEELTFFEAVAAGYADIAERERRRVRPIDAALPPSEVLARAVAEIADLLDT